MLQNVINFCWNFHPFFQLLFVDAEVKRGKCLLQKSNKIEERQEMKSNYAKLLTIIDQTSRHVIKTFSEVFREQLNRNIFHCLIP